MSSNNTVLRLSFVFFLILIAISLYGQELKFVKTVDKTPSPQTAQDEKSLSHIPAPGGAIPATINHRPADLNRGGLLFIQFQGEPTDEQFALLEKSGIRIHEYLGSDSYYVSAPEGFTAVNAAFLRTIVRPQPKDKITPELAGLLATGKTDAYITVQFVADTEFETVRGELVAMGARLHSKRMLFNDRLNVTISIERLDDLVSKENVLFIEPGPAKRILHNKNASQQMGSTSARNSYNINGSGVDVGVWDGGQVFKHTEFGNRLSIMENRDISNHATHVAGTIAAAGKNAAAKGMAPKAKILSYKFDGNPITEMSNAYKQNRIVIANNSWGYPMGWDWDPVAEVPLWFGNHLFGLYNAESSAIDALVNKGLLIVFSAGNDRNDGIFDLLYWDVQKQKYVYGFFIDEDGPYKILGPHGSAKNVIAIGATNGATAMAGFSSWGPPDGGWLQPYITAPGVNILSSIASSDTPGTSANLYGRLSGTSMAAPAVTGSIALLQELWKETVSVNSSPSKNDGYPSPAVIRNILAASAKDVGAKGPDYRYGWGPMDTMSAAEMIEASANANIIVEDKVKRNKINVYELNIPQTIKNVRVTLSWLDPPGKVPVNNLDLLVVNPKGKEFRPWKLNPKAPAANAKTGTNTLDNTERVDIKRAKKGTWEIHVIATKLGKGNKQKYVLSVWGS